MGKFGYLWLYMVKVPFSGQKSPNPKFSTTSTVHFPAVRLLQGKTKYLFPKVPKGSIMLHMYTPSPGNMLEKVKRRSMRTSHFQ